MFLFKYHNYKAYLKVFFSSLPRQSHFCCLNSTKSVGVCGLWWCGEGGGWLSVVSTVLYNLKTNKSQIVKIITFLLYIYYLYFNLYAFYLLLISSWQVLMLKILRIFALLIIWHYWQLWNVWYFFFYFNTLK